MCINSLQFLVRYRNDPEKSITDNNDDDIVNDNDDDYNQCSTNNDEDDEYNYYIISDIVADRRHQLNDHWNWKSFRSYGRRRHWSNHDYLQYDGRSDRHRY